MKYTLYVITLLLFSSQFVPITYYASQTYSDELMLNKEQALEYIDNKLSETDEVEIKPLIDSLSDDVIVSSINIYTASNLGSVNDLTPIELNAMMKFEQKLKAYTYEELTNSNLNYTSEIDDIEFSVINDKGNVLIQYQNKNYPYITNDSISVIEQIQRTKSLRANSNSSGDFNYQYVKTLYFTRSETAWAVEGAYLIGSIVAGFFSFGAGTIIAITGYVNSRYDQYTAKQYGKAVNYKSSDGKYLKSYRYWYSNSKRTRLVNSYITVYPA